MSVELVNKIDDSVPVIQLKDGQIAIIVKWSNPEYNGRIVQRYNNDLITLGRPLGNCWINYFKDNISGSSSRVRILKNGELIKVMDNQ